MIEWAAVILIIIWIFLIESIILAYHNIRNEQKRFDEEIKKMRLEKIENNPSKTNLRLFEEFRIKTLRFKPELMDLLKTTEKRATIRKSDKCLKKGDVVKCVADDGSSKVYRKVKKIEQVKFKNLHYRHANREGYHHVNLLKQELIDIYPGISDETVLYQIIFELPEYLWELF